MVTTFFLPGEVFVAFIVLDEDFVLNLEPFKQQNLFCLLNV